MPLHETETSNVSNQPDSQSVDYRQRLEQLSPERRALLARLLKQPTTNQPAGTEPERDGLPVATEASGDRFEPFPLNPLQQAYWLGRSDAFELGNLASRAYLEVECADFDLPRFEQAWRRL